MVLNKVYELITLCFHSRYTRINNNDILFYFVFNYIRDIDIHARLSIFWGISKMRYTLCLPCIINLIDKNNIRII